MSGSWMAAIVHGGADDHFLTNEKRTTRQTLTFAMIAPTEAAVNPYEYQEACDRVGECSHRFFGCRRKRVAPGYRTEFLLPINQAGFDT